MYYSATRAHEKYQEKQKSPGLLVERSKISWARDLSFSRYVGLAKFVTNGVCFCSFCPFWTLKGFEKNNPFLEPLASDKQRRNLSPNSSEKCCVHLPVRTGDIGRFSFTGIF